MNHMNDDQLDLTLRRFFVSESERIASTAVSEFEMADRLNIGVPRQWDRRLVLLVAAALLLAGLAAATILGSGLLRELPQVDHSLPRFLAAGACPSGMPDEMVLTATTQDGTGAHPWSTLTLYADGQLLSKPANGAPTVRQLSSRGVKRVVERASAVDVEGNCRSIFAQGTYRSLYVVTGDGFLSLTWGSEGAQGVHATTQEEKAAVEGLGGWLDGLDEWLLIDDWVDSTARPYVAAAWSVDIQRTFGGDGDPAGPDPATVAFPDGSTLSTFGVELPLLDPTDSSATVERCGTVTAAVAGEITSSLDATGAPNLEGSGGWLFSEDGGSGHDVIVQVEPLDPYSRGCLVALDQPSPAPSASPDPLAGFDPCSLLTNAQVKGILGWSVRGEAHLSALPGGMRDCVYFAGGSTGHLTLSFRQLTTSLDDGRELARELFGQDMSESVVQGTRTYANGCSETPVPCEPAIAVSSGPYFVVLAWADPREGTEPQALRALIEAVIESLGRE